MSRGICECPCCGNPVTVTWYWETTKTAQLDDTVGEVVTDRDCLDATRVVHLTRRSCPSCGARLRVWHELVPRFHAFEEISDDTN